MKASGLFRRDLKHICLLHGAGKAEISKLSTEAVLALSLICNPFCPDLSELSCGVALDVCGCGWRLLGSWLSAGCGSNINSLKENEKLPRFLTTKAKTKR